MNVRDIASDIDDSSINKGYIDESSSRIKNSYITDNPSISIIIPLYNEEHSIKNVIERIPNHSSYEIIVVDDGSTDKSVKRIREIKDKDIKIIQHEKNQGYGASILTGFNHATGDIIVTMDSDGQHNPEEISDLIKPIINDQADIVVGSRYLGSSTYKVRLYARVGEYFINLCLWFLYHQKICNNQSGFRAFTSSSLKKLNTMRHVKFGLCTETLFNAASKNLRIKEIPVNVYPRKHGCSYVKLFHIIKSISLCILFYGLKKFRVIRFVPKPIYDKFYNNIIK
ncbi:MAG: glycosyltransferase family 2 protein [Promethearchaeota archaeon]